MANGGRHSVPSTLIPNTASRGTGGRDGGRAPGHGQRCCAVSDGSVRIAAADRAGRERLLRYCVRPPFAPERLRELECDRLVYDNPKPGPGAPRTLILAPLELLDRLAAFLPSEIHPRRRKLWLRIRPVGTEKQGGHSSDNPRSEGSDF